MKVEIKKSLKELTELFARSASNEQLDNPVRQLAARLTVLTAHVERVEAKVDALDHKLAELVELVTIIVTKQKTAGTQVKTPATEQTVSEDDEAKAMAEKVMRDTAAEVAAAAVTPLRPPRNGETSEPAGEAS